MTGPRYRITRQRQLINHRRLMWRAYCRDCQTLAAIEVDWLDVLAVAAAHDATAHVPAVEPIRVPW